MVFSINFVVGMISFLLEVCSTGLKGTWLFGCVGYIWLAKEYSGDIARFVRPWVENELLVVNDFVLLMRWALEMESVFIAPQGCLRPMMFLLFLITASHAGTQSRRHSFPELEVRQEMQKDSKDEDSRHLGILSMGAQLVHKGELCVEVKLGGLLSAEH